MEEPTPPKADPPPGSLPAGRGSESPALSGSTEKRNRRRKPSFPTFVQGGPGSPAQPPVPHIITGQTVSETKLEFLQRLRREMTPEEKILWSRLRANRLRGLHFRRQQFIHGFVADFYCHAAGVVVEVDGGIHATQVEYDTARGDAFAAIGLLVLRFRNEEVTGSMPAVLEKVATACAERIAAQTNSTALPMKG